LIADTIFLQLNKNEGRVAVIFDKTSDKPLCLNGATAKVNYTGSLDSGYVFDSNTIKKFGHLEPFFFQIGRKQVIECWDESVQRMSPGTVATIWCPAKTAYGNKAVKEANVPPNSNLNF